MQSGVNDVNDILIGREGHRSNRLLLGLGAAAIMVLGALMGSVATARGWSPFGGEGNKVPVYYAADQTVKEPLNLNTGFSAVAKAVTPAVVTIRTQSRQRANRSQFIDPFREFFGVPDQDDELTPRRRTVPQQPENPQNPQNRGRLQPSGVGSGVLVSPDGYILTNNHVVDGAEKVTVELNDQSSHPAKVVGTDSRSDIAVLKIEGSGLPTVPIGDSSKVDVGDVVLAIGNPLNVGQTVTMGIISAKSRTTGTGGNATYEDFLQTDAAINRGNSGGALVNLRGELIGVPSQILAGGLGGNIGIGFAIPSTMARSVMDQLIRTGKVRRGILGVRVTGVDPAVADQLGYKGVKGALVQDVDAGKPAERAGIKAGDIITEYQGQRIEDSNQLRNLTSQTPPDTTVKLKVWRDGGEREFSAKLEELDTSTLASAQPDTPAPGSPGTDSSMAGVRVDNVTPENIRRFRLQDNARGVVVVSVDPDSNAAEQLRVGDVIEEVSRQPVSNVAEFNAAIAKVGKKNVLLRVRNLQGVRFAVIEAEK